MFLDLSKSQHKLNTRTPFPWNPLNVPDGPRERARTEVSRERQRYFSLVLLQKEPTQLLLCWTTYGEGKEKQENIPEAS